MSLGSLSKKQKIERFFLFFFFGSFILAFSIFPNLLSLSIFWFFSFFPFFSFFIAAAYWHFDEFRRFCRNRNRNFPKMRIVITFLSTFMRKYVTMIPRCKQKKIAVSVRKRSVSGLLKCLCSRLNRLR